MNHRVKVLSLCKDVIYISSKRKKQTPKHLSLGLAVRQITGSAKAVKLLNGFGHCVSNSRVLALDTALATANLNNASLVPKSIEPGKFTITVWDNCDFLEETESTSFPGPFLLWSKDPGRSWSREPPDFWDKLNLISGRGSRGVCLFLLENCNFMCYNFG
jgi:hypothetical protein